MGLFAGGVSLVRSPRASIAAWTSVPPLLPQATERTDSQAIGPSETYDVEHECGSGGCQQGAGDYMVHCHVAHHYLAGCGRSGGSTTRSRTSLSLDGLPPLAELPDRAGQMHTAVTSQELAGRTVDWKGQVFQITQENLGAWVERQLPPRGVPEATTPRCWTGSERVTST